MAKTSMLEREARRERIVAKYKARRTQLKQTIKNPQTSDEDRVAAMRMLQQLPRNANPCRLRNRCHITGRPRGYYRKFGLARNKLRQHAMEGNIPGLVKASW